MEKAKALSEAKGKNAPAGFAGIILETESWKICPYDGSHRYLRDKNHLARCRQKYIQEMESKKEELDIFICKFSYNHHIRTKKAYEKHLESCPNRHVIHAYLAEYAKAKRHFRAAGDVNKVGVAVPMSGAEVNESSISQNFEYVHK